VLFICAGCCE